MARLVVVGLAGVIVGMIGGAACGIQAAEPDDETIVLAVEVGVDAVELQGAVISTGSTPRTYLEHEGLIARPIVSTAVAPVQPIGWGLWDRLAACESSGNWSAVSRGGTYRGGVQFDQPTWRAYGGLAYAPSAHLASKAQQIAIAEKLRAARGLQPWPVCGKRV